MRIENGVFQQFQQDALARYPTEGSPDNHNQEHISSVLNNVDLITTSGDGSENPFTEGQVQNAKIAAIIHDWTRLPEFRGINIEEVFRDNLTAIQLEESDIEEIILAIRNHNRPKTEWHDPSHVVSQLLYDADKMDTRCERFKTDIPEYEFDENEYYGYVLMVNASTTYPIARNTLTAQLPPELVYNPSDERSSTGYIQKRNRRLRDIYQVVEAKGKKLIGNLYLQTFGDKRLQMILRDALDAEGDADLRNLSPTAAIMYGYSKIMSDVYRTGLNDLDSLVGMAASPGSTIEQREEIEISLRRKLDEKLFNFQMFVHALENYPREYDSDLEILLYRSEELIHGNMERIQPHLEAQRQVVGSEEYDRRMDYFTKLVDKYVTRISHYSRSSDLSEISAGRRLLDQAHEAIKQAKANITADMIDHMDVAEIDEMYNMRADMTLRYLKQDMLRAVDYYNDLLQTDRYVYFLLTGQLSDSPVRNLPYYYSLDTRDLEPRTDKEHFVGISHPQALRVMRLNHNMFDLPFAISKAIHAYTNNLFTPEDFRKLYASLFASQFSPDEMTEELFDYIFHNTIVNDDAEIGVNEDGDFIAPTKRSERGITDTGWVIVDFKKRRDPLWRQAHEAVGKINDSATELGIFNPLRPYFIIPRDIDLTAVNSKVEVNPLAIK